MSTALILQVVASLATVATLIGVLLFWLFNRRQMGQQAAEIKLVHSAVNSNYTVLSQRLDAALIVVQALKDEIIRLNTNGIITPREESTRGKVTLKDGVVDVPHPGESG